MKIAIYVLPTEKGIPAGAALIPVPEDFDGFDETVELVVAGNIPVARWSPDMGAWMMPDGTPAPAELAEAITERCRELEVLGF